VGIEAGPEGVAVAHGQWKQGQPELSFCEFVLETDESKHKAVIAELVEKYGLKGSPCSVVLHPSQYQLQLVEAPQVEPEELRDAVRWRVKDLINFSLDDAVVDVIPLPDDAFRGRMKMVFAVIAHREVVEKSIALVKDCGLAVEVVEITDMAIRNIIALASEEGPGVGLVRLRTTGGLINVAQEKNIYLSRAVETGLATLKQHGVMDLQVDYEDFHPQLDALVLELQRSFDYYESQLGKGVVKKLLLAPSKTDVPVLLPYLNRNLSTSVEQLDLNELIQGDLTLTAIEQAQCIAAVGAALRQEVASATG